MFLYFLLLVQLFDSLVGKEKEKILYIKFSTILGFCNGLLCMELSKNPHSTKDHILPMIALWLWNPLTNKSHILPKAPIEFAGLQNDHCVEVEYAFRHD